jgi:membrane protein insertase Oxa1/YidC/SpoIIIJ
MVLLVGSRWATIALTTFTARLCLFPITLYQMRSTAKMTVRKTAPTSCQSVHFC